MSADLGPDPPDGFVRARAAVRRLPHGATRPAPPAHRPAEDGKDVVAHRV